MGGDSDVKVLVKLKGDAAVCPLVSFSKSVMPTASCYGSVCQYVSSISLHPGR